MLRPIKIYPAIFLYFKEIKKTVRRIKDGIRWMRKPRTIVRIGSLELKTSKTNIERNKQNNKFKILGIQIKFFFFISSPLPAQSGQMAISSHSPLF
jgi:hypothetical protein